MQLKATYTRKTMTLQEKDAQPVWLDCKPERVVIIHICEVHALSAVFLRTDGTLGEDFLSRFSQVSMEATNGNSK